MSHLSLNMPELRLFKSDPIVSEGKRRLRREFTDFACAFLLIGLIGVYIYTVVVSYIYGNPSLLSAPRDYQGNACGVSGEYNSKGVDLGNYSYVGYTVNLTALSELFPSSSSVTDAEIYEDAVVTFNQSGWYNTFTGDVYTASFLLETFPTYFYAVCLPSCDQTDDTLTDTATIWKGPIKYKQRTRWDTFSSASYSGSNEYRVEPFKYKRYVSWYCPYDSDFCAQFAPASHTKEVLGRYCVPLDPSVNDTSSNGAIPYSWYADQLVWADLMFLWPQMLVGFGVAATLGLVAYVLMSMTQTNKAIIVFAILSIGFLATVAGYGILYVSEPIVTVEPYSYHTYHNFLSKVVRRATKGIVFALFGVIAIIALVAFMAVRRYKKPVEIGPVLSEERNWNKGVLLSTFTNFVVAVGWLIFWGYTAIYCVTQFKSTSQNPFYKYDQYTVYQWDLDYIWKDAYSLCDGDVYVAINGSAGSAYRNLYACKKKALNADWMIAIQLVALFVVNEFIVSCGYLMTASTVGTSYFTLKADRQVFKSFALSIKHVFKHFGSVMYSCFVQIIPWPKAAFVAILLSRKRRKYSFRERFLTFIVSCTKQSLVNIALTGHYLTLASRSSYVLIQREVVVKKILDLLVASNALGRCFVTFGTVGIGLLITVLWEHENVAGYLMIGILFLIIGYVIGGVAMNAVTAPMNALIQCFLIDRKVFKDRGAPQLSPPELLTFLQDNGIKTSETVEEEKA